MMSDVSEGWTISRMHRHADIQVTAKHYLDKKQRITIGFGRLLQSSGVAPASVTLEPQVPVNTKKPRKRAT